MEQRASIEGAEVGDLLQRAIEDARDLLRLEVSLAKQELAADARALRSASIALAIAASSVLVGLGALLGAAIVLGGTARPAFLVLAGVLVTTGAAAVIVALKRLPRSFLERTRKRVDDDVTQVREHVKA